MKIIFYGNIRRGTCPLTLEIKFNDLGRGIGRKFERVSNLNYNFRIARPSNSADRNSIQGYDILNFSSNAFNQGILLLALFINHFLKMVEQYGGYVEQA